jgi:hypothetical protein
VIFCTATLVRLRAAAIGSNATGLQGDVSKLGERNRLLTSIGAFQVIEDVNARLVAVRPSWLGGVPSLAAISLHLVTKRHHAVLVGFDLRQMERDISVELLERAVLEVKRF